MAAFKYNLQNILNLREQQEDMKLKEYAQSLERLKEQRLIKKQIDESLLSNRELFKNSISDYIDPNQIKQQLNYQMLLANKQAIAKDKVDKAKENTDVYREHLLKAMKERKTLDILKEKKLEEFKEEEKKEEQQIIDEIVSFSYTKSE